MKFKPERAAMAAAILCLLITTGFSHAPITRQDTSAGTTTFLPMIMGPAPKTVDILSNSTYFVDSAGSLHIAGEVANNTANHLRNVEITAKLFNTANQLVGTANTFTKLNSLPAGDWTCFELITDAPAGWASYRFDPPTYTTDGYPLPNVAVINPQASYDPDTGWFDITGQVMNESGRAVNFASPVGTLYNSDMKVMACDYAFVNGLNLAPAQMSAFDLSFVRQDYKDVNFYRIQVDGEVQ